MIIDKEIIKLVNIILKDISKLNEEELVGLLNGSKLITVKDVKIIKKKENSNMQSDSTICNLNSREEATKYLVENKFTIKQLRELAQNNEIYINSRWKKDIIIAKIVESLVGKKKKMKILLDKG